MCSLANSEDPDGMAHQSLHCLLRSKNIFRDRNTILFRYNSDIYNGPLQNYCIKQEGRIYWCTKGLLMHASGAYETSK